MQMKHQEGFTLIELSMVLVIIGLIVGGILVGQNLISAAAVRAQISQIEKFQTAKNTFYGKYGYLPGDIPNPYATQFGFAARGNYNGQGDGDGLITGVYANLPGIAADEYQEIGEPVMFWVDLSQAGLIEGSFTSASPTAAPTNTSIPMLFPQAKIGNGNFVSIYSVSSQYGGSWVCNGWCFPNVNTFSISVISGFGAGGTLNTLPGLTVAQAYAIDTKIDDGLPMWGRVETMGLNGYLPALPSGGGWSGANTLAQQSATATTCYDNGGVNGAIDHYSTQYNNGSGVNCALSIWFQ